ncbi:hypothetical protein HK102_001580 [Quaeritorhiza haematococci]|nr:hypothetical protein HK102_001580 [Quaeritorhiza haematococci]
MAYVSINRIRRQFEALHGGIGGRRIRSGPIFKAIKILMTMAILQVIVIPLYGIAGALFGRPQHRNISEVSLVAMVACTSIAVAGILWIIELTDQVHSRPPSPADTTGGSSNGKA